MYLKTEIKDFSQTCKTSKGTSTWGTLSSKLTLPESWSREHLSPPLHSSQHRVTLVQPTPDVTPAQPAHGLKAGTPSPCFRRTSCRSGLEAGSRALSPSALPSVSSVAAEPTVRTWSLVSTSWASGFRKAAGPSMPRSPTKRKQKPVSSSLWPGGSGACDPNEHPPNWSTSPALTSTRTSVNRGSHSIICVHFTKLPWLEAEVWMKRAWCCASDT